jgi:hypothetical protein
VYEAAQATEKFNGDEDLRTCGGCGHLSPPFPAETWGWHNYVRLHRAVYCGAERRDDLERTHEEDPAQPPLALTTP